MNISPNSYIQVSIVDDISIKKLNKKFRKKNIPTDVLSFNIDEQTQKGYYLGDVIVNKDQAQRQAPNYGNSLEEEISDLISHGVLHLLGVHHDEDFEDSEKEAREDKKNRKNQV